ncbi:uncharacterized protein LOC110876629 [Helianthus annuus]|uniref:uncharacterized protein LOC110876629 n=1 Tax=Helianthus annuus TaxID=4232 RepID=UPI000B8FA5AC|nr:uncharacterized protein LOC110876629 [Helianthus annuus]
MAAVTGGGGRLWGQRVAVVAATMGGGDGGGSGRRWWLVTSEVTLGGGGWWWQRRWVVAVTGLDQKHYHFSPLKPFFLFSVFSPANKTHFTSPYFTSDYPIINHRRRPPLHCQTSVSFTYKTLIYAAKALCAVTRYAPPVLAAKISSPSFVTRLFRHALEDSRPKSVLVHSLSVCISLLDPKRQTSGTYYIYSRQSTPGSVVTAKPETVEGMLESLGSLLKLLEVSAEESVLFTTYGSCSHHLEKIGGEIGGLTVERWSPAVINDGVIGGEIG